MNKTQLQNSTERLSRLTWNQLEQVLAVPSRPQPPIYFFLSKKSEGSLKGRSLYEIDLVHRQQFYGEGITLKHPPCAWVSRLDQVPEETGHLFALTYQLSTKKYAKATELTAPQELWSMTLHECFGQFASQLIVGLGPIPSRPKKRMRQPNELWRAAHEEGYYLASKLSRAFFDELVSPEKIKKWFRLNWYQQDKPTALLFLYELLNESAPTPDFKKVF